jgi:hypothetical protein
LSEGVETVKIPKYWGKTTQSARAPDGRAYRLICWQWSDTSRAEAQQKAGDRARELAQKVLAGGPLNRYGYAERPLREEITQSVKTQTGTEIGVVTRNLYGARILNTTNAMFIDIDIGEQASPAAAAGPLLRVSAWAGQHRDVGLRVYRTNAGLRCLITNQVFDPSQAQSLDILRALGSDPLYVRLCQAQGCFRARLTPKPWRANVGTPPNRYPWDDAGAEARYRVWQQRYEQSIQPFAVCKLVQQLGPAETHPDIAPVVALHDEVTRSGDNRPLA